MKKIGCFVFVLISVFSFSQTQEEIIKVENTNDARVIASFLKTYPKFPRNNAYKVSWQEF